MLLTYLRNYFNDLYCKDDDAQKEALKIVADFFCPKTLGISRYECKILSRDRAQPAVSVRGEGQCLLTAMTLLPGMELVLKKMSE